MLVVRVELWPRGDYTRPELLDTVFIVNDTTGDERIGNYEVGINKLPGAFTRRIEGWPRSRTPLALVREALKGVRL